MVPRNSYLLALEFPYDLPSAVWSDLRKILGSNMTFNKNFYNLLRKWIF